MLNFVFYGINRLFVKSISICYFEDYFETLLAPELTRDDLIQIKDITIFHSILQIL